MATKTKPVKTRRAAPGMGAIILDNGVAFRVWAPHAERVFVSGSFNDWKAHEHELRSEENGYWYGEVEQAKAGAEYKFLIINGEQELERQDPYAREVTHSAGNCVIYATHFDWEDDDEFVMPPWNELIIYEMHIGSFHTRRNNQSDDAPGDFALAIEKLPYLKELGINAIQIMPPVEFPGAYSWGYNPAVPFAVESDYGGPDALKELIKQAHKEGIAVIVDVVYNHFGPSDLDLWRFDGWYENEGGGIYFYNDHRAETPWGATRPDYGRPEVRQYIRDNALMWLEEFHADGLRWDATAYIRNVSGGEDPESELPEGWTLLQWVNEEMQAHNPAALSIAEDLKGNEWITKETGAGGAGFGAQWAADFVHTLREAMILPDDGSRDLSKIVPIIATRQHDDAFTRVIYTESHDEVANGKARLPEDIYPGEADSWFSRKRSTLGAAIVMTAPGIPMIFQGQEFLEDKWFEDTEPLDWSKTERFAGILQLYRDLMRLRRNLDGTTKGLIGQHVNVYHINDENKVLAYHRWADGGPQDSVVVVANLCGQTLDEYRIGLPAGGAWRIAFNSDWRGYSDDFSDVGAEAEVVVSEEGMDHFPASTTLALGPYSALILTQTA